ncbi:MAG TPA: pyridoxine 5'-phosphate synthase [Burkholderiales bacterium]|nr:pyridoxine 5'-phosphate synthase [Burkholderiales bacterium]
MTRLSVNLNKIALLRNSRALGIPSVIGCARIAIEAGAQGITVHPRPDARHIRSDDVRELAALLKAYPDVEFNIEGNPFENALDLVRETRPHQFTLVPDAPGAYTSDHGWNLPHDSERLREVIPAVKGLGVRVSLFMDPSLEAIRAAAKTGADRVELYTEPYARAFGTRDEPAELKRYAAAARAALDAGLAVNAGHDLNQQNLPSFLSAVPDVAEVSIGHALIADALEDGLARTVKAYLAALGRRA